jgi:D-Tyr-tRNAtyr deacylase
VERSHESENVERISGIKVFEDGSDTAQEKVDDSDGGLVVVNGSRHARSVVGATNKSGRVKSEGEWI